MTPDPAQRSASCRAYGISRKAGYEISGRYQEEGVEALRWLGEKPHCASVGAGDDAPSLSRICPFSLPTMNSEPNGER